MRLLCRAHHKLVRPASIAQHASLCSGDYVYLFDGVGEGSSGKRSRAADWKYAGGSSRDDDSIGAGGSSALSGSSGSRDSSEAQGSSGEGSSGEGSSGEGSSEEVESEEGSGSEGGSGSGEGSGSIEASGSGEGSSSIEASGSEEGSGSIEASGSGEGSGSEEAGDMEEGSGSGSDWVDEGIDEITDGGSDDWDWGAGPRWQQHNARRRAAAAELDAAAARAEGLRGGQPAATRLQPPGAAGHPVIVVRKRIREGMSVPRRLLQALGADDAAAVVDELQRRSPSSLQHSTLGQNAWQAALVGVGSRDRIHRAASFMSPHLMHSRLGSRLPRTLTRV